MLYNKTIVDYRGSGYRPENTIIDLGFASVNIGILCSISHSPRSILVFSVRYHIISTASIVNNCILSRFLTFRSSKNDITSCNIGV